MVTLRRVFGGVACIALVAGFSIGMAAEKEKADPKPDKKAEEVNTIVQDFATANDLIKFGYDNNMPTAIITGVHMLTVLNTKYQPDNKRVTVENAVKLDEKDKDAAAKAEKVRLKGMLTDALDMKAAANDAIKKFAELVEEQVGMGRGTPAGYTSTNITCKVGSPGSVKLRFYAGKSAIITISRTGMVNPGVPIKVTVTDGTNTYPATANAYKYSFIAPKDQFYTITATVTQAGPGCTVNVTTN